MLVQPYCINMARGRRDWTRAKFDRYLKEGRGQGVGKNYTSWIKINDFPSQGRSIRITGSIAKTESVL
jgi:hypothetical protein